MCDPINPCTLCQTWRTIRERIGSPCHCTSSSSRHSLPPFVRQWRPRSFAWASKLCSGCPSVPRVQSAQRHDSGPSIVACFGDLVSPQPRSWPWRAPPARTMHSIIDRVPSTSHGLPQHELVHGKLCVSSSSLGVPPERSMQPLGPRQSAPTLPAQPALALAAGNDYVRRPEQLAALVSSTEALRFVRCLLQSSSRPAVSPVIEARAAATVTHLSAAST